MSSVFVSVNVFNVGVNSVLSVSMDQVSGLSVFNIVYIAVK